MDFVECTELARKHNARVRRNAKIKYFLVNGALAVAGAICLYGMLWLGAFLDYVAGV